MINYFLVINQYQTWLSKWLENFINNDATIIKICGNITKTLNYTKGGMKYPALTGFQKNSYYAYFGKGVNKRFLTSSEFESLTIKIPQQKITIKLFDLQFEELDNLKQKYNMKIKEIRSFISKKMDFNKDEADLFLVSAFLLHQEIKRHCEKKKSLFQKLPTFSGFKEMNNPRNNDKYNLLQYKKYLSMQLNAIWEQKELENFAEKIIEPFFQLEYEAPKLPKEIIDLLKKKTTKNNLSSQMKNVLLITLQFIFSYSYYKNLRYIYLYDIPPCMKKIKISKDITIDVLLACSKLCKDDPDLFETTIMRKVAEQYDNFVWTTIRNFVKENKKFSPQKIGSVKSFFELSDEDIKKFYNNYRIGRGHQSIE